MAQAVPVMIQSAAMQETGTVKDGIGLRKDNPGKSSKIQKGDTASTSEAKGSEGERSFTDVLMKVREKLTGGKEPDEKDHARLAAGLKEAAQGLLEHISLKQLISLLKHIFEKTDRNDKGADLLSELFKKIKESAGKEAGEEKDTVLKKLGLLLNRIFDDGNRGALKLFEQMLGRNEKQRALKDTGDAARIEKEGTGPLPKIVVLDLRKKPEEGSGAGTVKVKAGHDEGGKVEFTAQGSSTERSAADTVLVFSHRTMGGDTEGNGSGAKVSGGQGSFDRQLVKNLRENLSSEMVKHTRIIVKEDGGGELRIVLKPESLGSIRMRINMQNNHIDGRIFVDNNNVRGIVESALDNLQHALKNEGFDSISLKVSVGQDYGKQDNEANEEAPYAKAGVIEEFEKNIPVLSILDEEYARVNLIV